MLKLKSKIFASILALAFVPSLALAAPIEFNFQSPYPGPHVFNVKTAQPWANSLEKVSNGKLKAHYFMGDGIVKMNDAAHAIIAGTLDMGPATTNFIPDITPISANMDIPFTSDDAMHATTFYNKLYAENKEVQDEIAKVGKFIAMWGSDRAAFFSTTGPILSPEDLKGKRVLVWFGKQVAQVQAWGGIPVQIPTSDTYLGLQRGMGEVFLGPLPVGVSMKIMEVTKHVTPISAISTSAVITMSWDLWNDLSAEEQKIITDTTKDWGVKTGKDLVETTNKDIETMKKAGLNFHDLSATELNKFKELDKVVTMKFIADAFKRYGVKKDATQWVNYLYKLSDETRQK